MIDKSFGKTKPKHMVTEPKETKKKKVPEIVKIVKRKEKQTSHMDSAVILESINGQVSDFLFSVKN